MDYRCSHLQRVSFAEIPDLFTRHYNVIRYPMPFIREFHQDNLHSFFTWSPCVSGDMAGTIWLLYFGFGRTSVSFDPSGKNVCHSAEIDHVVACSMRVDDGYRTSTGKVTSPHRITAYRGKCGYLIGYLIHGVISKHTTHRETRQIDAVTVNAILIDHLVYKSKHEANVTVTGDVPSFVNTVRKDGDKLCRVSYRLYLKHSTLIGSILVHSMA